jgi:hypothetical protein
MIRRPFSTNATNSLATRLLSRPFIIREVTLANLDLVNFFKNPLFVSDRVHDAIYDLEKNIAPQTSREKAPRRA